MKKEIEELIFAYTAIVNQSKLMIHSVSDKEDKIKLEAGMVSLNMVIDDLKKLL